MATKDNVLSTAGIGDRNVRLEDEFERTMRLTAWLRETLEAEFSSAFGTRSQTGVDDKTMRKWQQLVGCLKDLADTKIRLEKHAKDPARPMTPEREESIVRQYVRALPADRRAAFLAGEYEFHKSSVPA